LSVIYVDTNVFVYAFLKLRRKLHPHEENIKDAAKKIVSRINEGEQVVTSVIHFSEVCNILEDHLSFEEALLIERGLLFRENILIHEVSAEDYVKALSINQDHQIGINDALAYVLMKETGLHKIYSFDKDFNVFKDIERSED
jgi:predicted nucleic acid-binding protein